MGRFTAMAGSVVESCIMKRHTVALRYHEESKHSPARYARGPGGLDWATQPSPFRKYAGADAFALALLRKDPAACFTEAFSPPRGEPRPLDAPSVAALLELSLGLSAWKSYGGDSWALRMNPSSGNLHPVEAHLLIPSGLEAGPGVYHYEPYSHSLEKRLSLGDNAALHIERHYGRPGLFVGLTAIHWKEAWKYGERAWRYCQLDTGHAIACISVAARLLGWRAERVDAVPDADIARLLGLDRTTWPENEAEETSALIFIHAGEECLPAGLPKAILDEAGSTAVSGEPSALSQGHVPWPSIEDVSRQTRSEGLAAGRADAGLRPVLPTPPGAPSAAAVIRKRRSAQAYDETASMPAEAFYSILEQTMPASARPPFDALGCPTAVSLLLFVHRVAGVRPGLYLLARCADDLPALKEKLKKDFLWEHPLGAPTGVPLYLLAEGDAREAAAFLSCRQEIAGDSAFCLGMLARFAAEVKKDPHAYRRLFWECGAVGQTLYLAAEAWGFSGTGIGCFYDDTVHNIAGLEDATFQSLYHFTVGKALTDERIRTLPPYAHIEGRRG